METYKAEGVILRARDYAEADKLLTIYTREWGKVQAIAKGVRKIKSKNRGAVQLFSYSSFVLYKGRSLDTVTQCNLNESFSVIRDNLTKMAYASYIVELTDKLVIEKEPNPDIFNLLLATMYLLENQELPLLKGVYIIRLLTLLGYQPQLEECVSCGQPFSLQGTYKLSPTLGGLICRNCFLKDPFSKPLSNGGVAILKKFLQMDLRKLNLLKINTPMFNEVNLALKSYLKTYLDYPLKSEEFLEGIIGIDL